MEIRSRVAQAPSEPMPELAEFLAPFRVHLPRGSAPECSTGMSPDF
jgi:hypothetical protein